ncbi:MAG TPA: VOC family protein [Pyrinomonadaceae bacterium]|jgi:catechol 2,3-dioxygenase-like lactoylglutathione lyase family enzyme|nr:VOC family protein [Pyrinomonadaceae bacterium]
MLTDSKAVATIGVKKIDDAKKFYEGKLGFKPKGDEHEGVVAYDSGGSMLFVYQSEYAGTNKATAATWVVDDVDGTVKTLKRKGVSFEHYNFPDTKVEGDIHVSGKMRAAWFKDPDGNILAIVNDTEH